MGHRKKKWMGVAGALVVSGVLFVAGLGSPSVQAAGNPFNEILDKLNQILAAINGIQQSNSILRWDQALPSAQRFVILRAFNNEAVLDKNTGLVWEQSPDTNSTVWSSSRVVCASKAVGGQKGWRLPSIAELSSLVDPSVWPAPTPPPGHPFTNVLPVPRWSASTDASNPTNAWGVFFNVGGGQVTVISKTSSSFIWCVRGGMNADQY